MNLATIAREFKAIPIGLIDAPELPSRSTMDEQKLDELVDSIRRIGLQQPMVLARVGDRFEVIAGNRRLLACRRAGLVDAPCIIYPSKDVALEAIKYAENRHREDLNVADEAIWFDELLERDCGGDVDVLCERLGESRGYVEGRLNLFRGDPDVFEALRAAPEKRIKLGVAQQLNRITDPGWRRYYLDCAVRGGATVAVVSGWVADWQREHAPVTAAPQPASPPAPVPETNYFRCACCGRTDNVHLMQPINVHSHCKLAILDPLLAAYRGEA